MNINIIAVGKIREKYIKEGLEEFLKRTCPYSQVKITEISASDYKNNSNLDKYLEIEAEKILKMITENSFVILMDINGKQLSSEKFAEKIKELNTEGFNQIIFIMGGAFGVHDKIKHRADFKLSLSDMTFPHQIARLLLAEQIYRAFRIINNEPYHN